MDPTEILLGERGVWGATPWDYSSLRFLWFHDDATGQMLYGYGQTIYAEIRFEWRVTEAGLLWLSYRDSPGNGLRFEGFTPTEDDRVRELGLTLTPGYVAGHENILGRPFAFGWTMELSEPPWPASLNLPRTPPRIFYGHRRNEDQRDKANLV